MATVTIQIEWNSPVPATIEHIEAQRKRIVAGTLTRTTYSNEVEVFWDGTISELCERVFHETNIYEGNFWDAIQPLPEKRSHTALSMGDVVIVNGDRYSCEEIGFKKLEKDEQPYLPGYIL